MSELTDRIDERLTALGRSDREVSMLVTDGRSGDLIRDLRRGRGSRMGLERYQALAEALETTVEWLRYGRETGAVVADRRTGYDAGSSDKAFDATMPQNLPVYGTALGADIDFDRSDPVEVHIVELTEAIDWVRRPPLLARRGDVYALYITGSSMEPRFEPGDPVIVDPKRPPRAGDDVIVQLRDDSDGRVKAALIKRLVKRTSTVLELRQYNPPITFTIPLDQVRDVHRVVMMRDLLG